MVKINQIIDNLTIKLPIILKTVNLIRGFIGKTIQITNNLNLAVTKIGNIIIAKADDLLNIIKQLDNQGLERLLEVIKNPGLRDILRKYKSALSDLENYVCNNGKCFISCLSNLSLSKAPQTNSSLTLQSNPVTLFKSSTSGSVCNRLSRNINEVIKNLGNEISYEIKEALVHVIIGEEDLEGDMHHADAIQEKYDKGMIEVYDLCSKTEVSGSGALKNVLANCGEVKFKPKGDKRAWSNFNPKGVFPTEWTIEDIARAGEELYDPSNLVQEQGPGSGTYRKDITKRGRTVTMGSTVGSGGVKGKPKITSFFKKVNKL